MSNKDINISLYHWFKAWVAQDGADDDGEGSSVSFPKPVGNEQGYGV